MGTANTDVNNFVTYRGDDLSFELVFADTDGVPVNITGWTIFFTMKLNKDDSDSEAIISKTITSLTNPTNGKTTVVIPHGEVDELTGPFFYDFQFKDLSDNVRTITSGAITFEKDITRRTA
jgi:hypothetical protein